jgi:hypothetical protein
MEKVGDGPTSGDRKAGGVLSKIRLTETQKKATMGCRQSFA